MLTDDDVDAIADGHADSALGPREKAALALTDAFLALPGGVPAALPGSVTGVLSREEIAEIGLALAVFHGYVRVIISLGFEPEDMAVTVLAPYGHT